MREADRLHVIERRTRTLRSDHWSCWLPLREPPSIKRREQNRRTVALNDLADGAAEYRLATFVREQQ